MSKKITIYKGPVYRAFADNVTLVENSKNKVIFAQKSIVVPSVMPEVKTEVAHEEELFYSLHRAFVSLKYNCILADNEEVMDFIAYFISRNNDKIVDYMKEVKGNPEKEKEFKKYLRALTSCIYFDPSKLRRDTQITKDEFKELKKSYSEESK